MTKHQTHTHRAYWGIGGYREGYRVRVYNRIATREPTSPWWGGEPIAKFSGTCTVIAFFFCFLFLFFGFFNIYYYLVSTIATNEAHYSITNKKQTTISKNNTQQH